MQFSSTSHDDCAPEIALSRWTIVRDAHGALHVVGWNIAAGEGRASSAVVRVDLESRRLTTLSGRVYFLEGPPSPDPDGLYVWKCWCALLGAKNWTDVTQELLAARPRAQS
jgi:hypothetical protein